MDKISDVVDKVDKIVDNFGILWITCGYLKRRPQAPDGLGLWLNFGFE